MDPYLNAAGRFGARRLPSLPTTEVRLISCDIEPSSFYMPWFPLNRYTLHREKSYCLEL